MKPFPSLVAVLFSLSCCSGPLSWAAENAPGPAPDQVAKLIAQLDHDDFDKREEAMAKLVNIGEQAMPYLTKALENKGGSPEVEHRIRYLLGTLSGPEHGVVWRTLLSPGLVHNEKAVVPEGIQPGDVITQIDDRPIDSDAVAERFGRRRYQNATATIWRKGKTLQLTLTMNVETALCFHCWPDPTRQYEQFGHRGKWDQAVLQALAIGTIYSNNKCEPLYKQAYDAGCRDAMVVYYWADHLVKLGKLEEAEKIVTAARAEKLVGHPGGKFLYAELPILHASIFRYQNKFEEARKIMATAEVEAQKNGAFQAIKSLKYHLLRSVRYDDTPDPLAFLKSAKDFPYDSLMPKDVATWCQIVSGEGDPSRALELLAFLRPKLQNWEPANVDDLDELVKYYESQNELAKTFKASPTAKRKQVPVLCEGGFWTCNAQPGTYVIMPGMPSFKTPGSIDVHMRYWEFPKNYGAWSPYFRFGCKSLPGSDPMDISMSISNTGAYSFGLRMNGEPAYPDRLFGGMEWGDIFGDKRIRISVAEGRAQLTINGRIFRTYYYPGKPPEELRTFMSCSSAKAWFYNFMHYAPTDLDVDAKPIEDAWSAWQDAGKGGDRAKIESAADKLLALLKPFPEAKRGIGHVEAVLRNIKALYQPDGWRADARAVLDDPQTDAVGLWEASGDWLVGMNRPDWTEGEKLFCQIPMILPKDFEMTGQVAAEGFLCPHIAFMLFWNNNLMRSAMNSYPAKPFVDVPWTKPPGERRTPAQEQAAKDFVNRMKKERTFSFCLRKVGQKAALFVNGVEGPLLNVEYPPDVGMGQYLCFHQNCPHGLFMFCGIKVRPIDPGTELNAPVQLPEMKPVPAKAQLKNLYDRAGKIKADMDKANDDKKKGQ
jgi:hypothetical protein